MKIKFGAVKGLAVLTFLGGIALDLLGRKVEADERENMKTELKKEIMDEMSKKN